MGVARDSDGGAPEQPTLHQTEFAAQRILRLYRIFDTVGLFAGHKKTAAAMAEAALAVHTLIEQF